MAFTNRYQKTIKGNLIQIGNTLGLSKASGALTPGTLGSIGAFTTTQNLTAAGGWPAGTTLSFAQNSSAAILTLPSGAIVDYAELIWSASHIVPGSDVSASIGNPISFTDPRGITTNISATGVNITGIGLSEGGQSSTNYVKSADVTSIVSAAGSGTYICGNVPCALSATSDFLTFAGWSLYVVYRLSSDPVRNIIIFVGQTVSLDVPYAVPINYPGPPFPIRLYYTVGEGDAIITGDQFNTRPATGVVVVNLGTSVQPANSNPFASIIGDQAGGIDTTGTFGTRNPSGTTNTNISAGRQGWDIANNINLLPAFTGGAVSSLGLDIGTNNDPAIMNANGFVVDLNQPIATLTKSVDKTLARGGDTLNYTLVYRFTTVPMTAANLIVVDTVPSGTTYQSGSVFVNNVPQPTFNPNPPGINLGTVSGVTTYTITYRATVNNVVDLTTIPNDAFGSYQFVSGGTSFVNENTSNTVITTVDPFNSRATKARDLSFGTIGDVINYTVTIPNTGATLTNVIFKDTIPNGTSFISGFYIINGVSTALSNPNGGVSLGTLPVGSFTTVTFSVLVTTIPCPNPISNSASLSSNYTFFPTLPNGALGGVNTNSVTTTINAAVITTSKVVNKTFANVGDILTYTIPIKNNGNVTAFSINFSDTVPSGTTLLPGSFTQNGSALGTGPNPPGVTLNNIAPGATTTIVFKVTVNTIPTPNPIPNAATTLFTYTIDSSTVPNRTSTQSSNTNLVNTQVNNANLGNITKAVSKTFANCGDTIDYVIVIPNSGNVTAQNIFFKDTVPNGTAFVTNSVIINGTPQSGLNPGSGFTVPNIAPGATATIFYSVLVQC